MTRLSTLGRWGLLLPVAIRIEAALLLGSVIAFAWIEVAWVAAIYWLMNASADLLTRPENVEHYVFLKHLGSWFGVADERRLLQLAAAGTMLVVVIRNLWGVLVTWQRARFVKHTEAATMTRLMRNYLTRPYSFFLTRNSAALAKNTLVEVTILVSVSVLSAINIAIDAATCVTLIAYLILEKPLVTLSSLVVFALFLGALYGLVRLRLKAMGARGRGIEEGMFRAAQEALGGIKDVKILGRERHFLDRFRDFADAKARLHVEGTMLKESPRYLVEALAFIGIVGSMIAVIGSGAGVTEAAGLLVLYGVAGFRLIPAMYRIYNGISNFSFAQAVFEAITEDLAAGESATIPASGVVPLPLGSSIRMQGIRFRYESSTSDVLSGIDLEIRANESIAFVGPTGAGKTTLVDILLGLHRPNSGQIAVDGTPIDERKIDSWRASIGYVPQHIFLADASISSNIAFGRSDGEIDRAAVMRAAKTAHLHDFVMSLPKGYDTETGERGVRLSGGQRQRIGIARALYRQPNVLVLDEATSALDGITESVISEAIRDLHGQVTLIIIAHRLSTVRHCDMIYMMESGRIVDRGRYEDLMARSATFRAMAGLDHA